VHSGCLQLLVEFKPKTTKENRGKALGKAKAEKKMLLRAGNAAGGSDGDLFVVKVTQSNESKRVGLKAAAADTKLGKRTVHVQATQDIQQQQQQQQQCLGVARPFQQLCSHAVYSSSC
jgi:hypothetical protein